MRKNLELSILMFVLIFALIFASIPALSEAAVSEAAPTEDSTAERSWRNILLLGVDARDFSRLDRSDSMIILSLNEEEACVKLTSIMRDTWVDFPGTSKSGKINAGTVYGGPELSMETVNKYFGTDIDTYVLVNFQDIIRIIDMLGGVELDITEAERRYVNGCVNDYNDGYTGSLSLEKAGHVRMNGAQALAFSRDRTTGGSDFERVKRQRKVLTAMLEAAQKCSINDLAAIALKVMSAVKTNLTAADVTAFVPIALKVDTEEMEELTIPADGTYKCGMMNGTWKIVPNFESNRELLHDFIYNDGAITEALSEGSNGAGVMRLQQKLVDLGYLSYADGIFGKLTKAAVEEAQEDFGYERTGIADVEFTRALLEK